MTRDDIKVLMDPRSTIAGMRDTVAEISNCAKTARDHIAFLDGHRAYIQFGGEKVGDGYIAFNTEDGKWEARMIHKAGERDKNVAPDADLCTLDDALVVYEEAFFWATKK